MTKIGVSCLAVAVAAGVITWAACGSKSAVTNPPASGTVTTTVSDPATCSANGGNGAYSHVWVSVTDVLIHASSSAGPNDPGWIDLTPSLKGGAPMQIDLLGQANNQCFLATFGSATEIQAGQYQQIRIMLAPDSAAPSINNNQCGNAANCVVLAGGTVVPLTLTSEAQTGLKIPSGQLAGGQFTVAAGKTEDLNIDFNTCASIVATGSGKFLLKPVLHAGEVSTTASSINGAIVDHATGKPIAGGTTLVALETKDSAGIDRVQMETKADANGNFVFCPVPAGTYDLVAVAVDKNNVAYAATVTTGVTNGTSVGNVPLYAVTAPADTVTGLATSTGGGAAVSVLATISALQAVGGSGSTLVTVPLAQQASSTQSLQTAASTSTLTCPANTDCAQYALDLPVGLPTVGAFAAGGTSYTAAAAATSADYLVDGLAFNVTSKDADCGTPPSVQAKVTVTTQAQNVTGPAINFTSCQ